jgi:N-acetylglucosaminyldiphosphoundecaprenol N-acetyl-beta-D-mannosaminyltransferase
MQQAIDEVVLASDENRWCFISTPNLNFLCTAQTDASFRQSVINSDLSIADGMSVTLLARILNVPVPERVAGSDLIEHLTERDTKSPLKAFFFGGESGVAEKASANLNELDAGVVSVGHFTPGFGSVEKMSDEAIISEINKQDVDFLIVSLGAKKGQAWIEKNKDKLTASVVSHLGAVVNFYAGTVQRAPTFWQNIGLEWFWRIYQEPKLWRRYFNDGMKMLTMMTVNIAPYWIWLNFFQDKSASTSLKAEGKVIDDDNSFVIHVSGNCCGTNNDPLREVFKQGVLSNKDIIIDIENVSAIDGSFIGLCMLIHKYLQKNKKSLQLINRNSTVRKIIRWNRAEYIFKPFGVENK